MKKILMVGLIAGLFSVSAFAADGACTATAALAGTNSGDVGAPDTAPVAGAHCACDGDTARQTLIHGGSGEVVKEPIFVNTGFNVQCSANTIVSFEEVTGNEFVVASGSRRGNQSYAGSSNGGAVTTSAKCGGTNAACQADDVTKALDDAKSATTPPV